jgi:hypothetical protein
MKVADRGISTINDRYSMVNPRVSPNPGMTRPALTPGVIAATGVAMVVLCSKEN